MAFQQSPLARAGEGAVAHGSAIDQLKAHLAQIDRASDVEWVEQLSERKREEAVFHDERDDRKVPANADPLSAPKANKKYYEYTDKPRAYSDQWIARHSAGKVFLDFACGDGRAAVKAAKAGAKLAIGIDISEVSVKSAREFARAEGVSDNTYFIQGDCEDTRLPENSIDAVFCCGMLHHIDLSYVYPELRRVLKPGGRVLAYEALNYNPAIKLYRMLTPELRTAWEKEHILSLKDVRFGKHFFDIGEVRFWNMLSILSPHMKPLAPLFSRIDDVLTRIPLLQLMSWIFTFELVKRQPET